MNEPPSAEPRPAADVVCVGESMVAFLPTRAGRLADVPAFARAVGGAESNVACALAAAGHRARWIGRVGRDGFGDHLVETIGGYGVDVTAVGRDPHRPTGVYFRTDDDRATDAHEVVYYRAGSAASAMSPATVPYGSVADTRVLHLTGITAALSEDCLALLRELTEPRPGRPLISFDVNHRPALWRDGTAPDVLRGLARRADLVFVGADEARRLWGATSPRAVSGLLPEPALLVVKLGGGGAVAVARPSGAPAAVTLVRAPRVDVVSPVGAGDAFAAGFLSATLRGLGMTARLRHGHLMAAAALTVPGDLAPPPRRAHADRLVALDEATWGRLHLGPGWTSEPEVPTGRGKHEAAGTGEPEAPTGRRHEGPGRTGDDQEVRTP